MDDDECALERRVSKRQRTVPSNLIDNYHYDQRIMKLAKQPQPTVCGADSAANYVEKYGILIGRLKKI